MHGSSVRPPVCRLHRCPADLQDGDAIGHVVLDRNGKVTGVTLEYLADIGETQGASMPSGTGTLR